MSQVMRDTGTEDYASVKRSGLSANPSPRAADAPSRGIKFPIGDTMTKHMTRQLLCGLAILTLLLGTAELRASIIITGESVYDFSSEYDEAITRAAVNVVDESGLTLQSPDVWHHGNDVKALHMWLSEQFDPTPWIEFDLGAEFELDEIHFWNNNESDAGNLRGAESIDVYVSNTPGTAGNNTDDGAWGTKIATLNPSIGPGLANYAGERFDITDTTGRYVRFDITDNYGDTFGGFSEVHFYATPEPATMSMLALGAMGVLARRKRRA